MSTTLQLPQIGKLKRRRTAATCACHNKKGRLFITDKNTKQVFLIDTGADISLIPRRSCDNLQPSETVLFAANGSSIPTFGERVLHIDIG